MDKKKILAILFVVLAGVFVSGCTKQEDPQPLTTIGDEADAVVDDTPAVAEDEEDDVADVDIVEAEDDDDVDAEEAEDDSDDSEEMTYSDEFNGATASDGARVTTWSYETASGVMSFMWTFKTDEVASYKVGYDDDNNIVIEFSSLVYASADDKTTELGSLLPNLMYEKTETGAKYTFMTGEEMTYELVRNGSDLTFKLEL